jgi:hypothetical protein
MNKTDEMILIRKKEKQIKAFFKTKMDKLYLMIKNQSTSKPLLLEDLNTHFSQFVISYDKATSVYCLSNHLGNGCQFVLGTTYVSKYVDPKP